MTRYEVDCFLARQGSKKKDISKDDFSQRKSRI